MLPYKRRPTEVFRHKHWCCTYLIGCVLQIAKRSSYIKPVAHLPVSNHLRHPTISVHLKKKKEKNVLLHLYSEPWWKTSLMRDLSLKTTFFSEAFPLNPGHLTLSALRSCLSSHLFKLSKCVCVCVCVCVRACVRACLRACMCVWLLLACFSVCKFFCCFF